MSASSPKSCPCPICPPNTVFVRNYVGNLMQCTRRHKFYVEWGKTTLRDLVLAVDADGHKKGERFPVPDDVEL